MKIDDRVEPLFRETLAALVKADPERFRRALAAFPDEVAMTTAYRLAAAVAVYVLHDQYGRRPTPAEVRAVAEKAAELENWTDVTAGEVTAFLTAYYDGTVVDQVMPIERAALVSFVLATNLLMSCHRDGEWWFDYLDRAEAAIESS